MDGSGDFTFDLTPDEPLWVTDGHARVEMLETFEVRRSDQERNQYGLRYIPEELLGNVFDDLEEDRSRREM